MPWGSRFAVVAVGLALSGCGDDGGKAGDKSDDASASVPARVTGVVGETLKTADDYEANGRPVTERLAITVLSVRDNATPSDPNVARFLRKKGHRWIAVKLRIRQAGSTRTGVLTGQFSGATADGRQFAADNVGVVEPSIAPSSNSVDLGPGDSRKGFLTIQVPNGVRLSELQFADSGFGPPPDFAVWKLGT